MSTTRPFYAAYASAYDLLVTDPVEPWVRAVHARLPGRVPACILAVTAVRPAPVTPPLATVTRVVEVLQRHGMAPALGGSGLLVALGLTDRANDWDVAVDAPDDAVRAALDEAGLAYRDATDRSGVYATAWRYVIDGGDHDVDLLVRFALRGPDGVEQLPARVTGHWRGLPLGDPAVWLRAYRLLDRPGRADVLERWTARTAPPRR
ncbi:hypothetical protein ACU61A_30325 [Pseudonocardia sichuanensis]